MSFNVHPVVHLFGPLPADQHPKLREEINAGRARPSSSGAARRASSTVSDVQRSTDCHAVRVRSSQQRHAPA